MYEYLKQMLEYIKTYNELPKDSIQFNDICLELYNNSNNLNDYQVQSLDLVLKICNTVYENSSTVLIDDDFYDHLVEIYRKYNGDFRIGAETIDINEMRNVITFIKKPEERDVISYNKYNEDNMMFYRDLSYNSPLDKYDLKKQNYTYNGDISKRKVLDSQLYPSLVGTLDKCKFVLDSQAKEKGVYNEPNVKIFERDFLIKHMKMGIINPHDKYTLIAELKYDGISICAEVQNGVIISANTRGDVKDDLSADLTPIFAGYKFYRVNEDISNGEKYGVKFEAVMTKYNLMMYNQMKGRSYANGRTAIIGLLSSSDAYKYRDLITLVPLDWSYSDQMTELGDNYELAYILGTRKMQIQLLNDRFRNGQINRFTIMEGDYKSLLFQVKRFVEEAEMMRDFIPYMYDGVVISYDDPSIRKQLGREHSVNKYSIAIKFSALKKSTIFTGYTYTVGQDGSITPMIHYNPVMFFGTIHDKASAHSYDRFMKLGLRKGDVVDVEYTNDVMAYVTKPDNSHNASNNNPLEVFPTHCPSCGSKLVISKSGKQVMCENKDCPERNIRRIDNMFKKLNIKDFSEAYLTRIGRYHLKDLMSLTKDDVSFLGEVNSQKFVDSMRYLQTNPIYDYKIIGSLGFNNVGSEKWKIIFTKYDLHEFVNLMNNNCLPMESLTNLKGLGPETVNTIFNEYEFFKEDIMFIETFKNVKSIKHDIENINIKKIRFTGVRDSELINFVSNMGHDINGTGSVTKDTDILIVPYENYSSSKVSKAISNGNTLIVPIDAFKENLNEYLK